ncbi:HAD family phosphatase [Kitasatospora sp. SUK 42]|nr:HAD family phosphatase [Kitasatospora sp. SUK 42]
MSSGSTAQFAVWTDFGGVLTPPLGHTFQKFCTTTRIDPDALMSALGKVSARYGTDDFMLPIDTPLITEAQWLQEIAEVLHAEHGYTTQLTTLADIWFDGRETNHAWVARLEKLRSAGTFVGMLSNMPPAWDGHWRRMVDPSALFDDVLLSFEVGHRKPSPGMFALAAERAGVPAERCVLVDDLPHNCAGAREAGWSAVLFTEAESASAELDSILVG